MFAVVEALAVEMIRHLRRRRRASRQEYRSCRQTDCDDDAPNRCPHATLMLPLA